MEDPAKYLNIPITPGILAEWKSNPAFRAFWMGKSAPTKKRKGPGVVGKIIGFAKSLTQHVLSGCPKPSAEEIARRRAICESCGDRVRGVCTVCGCNTNLKTSWLLQECPHPAGDKWRIALPVLEASEEADHYAILKMQLPPGIPSGDAMRDGLKRVCNHRTSMPSRMKGRGIVYAAGGPRFMCGVYVSVKMARWLGCDYPVEVWYNGDLPNEYHDHYPEIFKGLNVTFRDAATELRRLGIKRRCSLDGWPLKPLAYLLSSFEEVLGLDADCYPVLDVRPLFEHKLYRRRGAILWPDRSSDKMGAPLQPEQWKHFGMDDRKTPGIESGQVVINKRVNWHPLAVVAWLNDHHDFCYLPGGPAGLYGDKDTFAIGFHAADEFGGAKLGTPYVQAPPTRWLHVAFMQHDLTGQTMFVHRCRDKPRIEAYDYGTKQREPNGMIRCDAAGGKEPPIAHEWKVFDLVAEYSRALAGAEVVAKQIRDMVEFMASIGEPPAGEGRGIVITTSAPFAAGTFVLLKQIRATGCNLPIQLWHRRQDPPPAALLEFEGVSLRCLNDVIPEEEQNYRQYQHYAAMRSSGWQQVMYLDADLYPAADPTVCFDDLKDGFALWQDIDSSDAFVPELYGLSGREGFQPQGGVKVVDLAVAWPVLRLAEWLCQNEAFYFPGQAGDQSQLRAAMILHRFQPHNYGKVEHVADKALIHHRDGKPLFVHRVACKMGFPEAMRIDQLPMEAVAWQMFEEWQRMCPA